MNTVIAKPEVASESTTTEQWRLAALRSYGILDTRREPAFDDITRIAAMICDVPIAVVNLIDQERQWFKSEIGLGVNETSLETSFCAHAIRQQEMMVIPDTTADARFRDNPLVTGEPGLRFYAGAQLRTPDGHMLGTVCVLDMQPRELSPDQLDALRALARQVMAQLEMRRLLAASRQSSSYRSRLMAIAGHDLKTPLRSASYAISKVRRQVDDAQAKTLDTALDALRQIDGDFSELAAIAVTGSDDALPDLEDVALDEVLQSVLGTWRRLAELKKLQLRYVATSIHVQSHPVLLATLLGNLIGNAVKYTDKGSVLVGCRRQGAQVVVEIIDTGCGLAPEQSGQLFQAFHQLDPSSDGLGLGLWIVHSTAETLGHTIQVRSIAGSGSRFSVQMARLPTR